MREAIVLVTLAVLTGAGCSAEPSQRLDVFAASSLSEAFGMLEQRFEAMHPGVDVAVTTAGSQVLRVQIEHGAAADVFASANTSHVQALMDSGHVSDCRVFAHNDLVVITPADNPSELQTFADLRRAERLVIGSPNVPAGDYARRVLNRAADTFGPDFETAVLSSVVSEENNVRHLRAKVELGEADAAIVYRTDTVWTDDVRVVEIPAGMNVRADYTIAAIKEIGTLADDWQALVFSAEGRRILTRHGFSVE